MDDLLCRLCGATANITGPGQPSTCPACGADALTAIVVCERPAGTGHNTCQAMWKSPIRPSDNLYCDLPAGHDGDSHEGGSGIYRFVWAAGGAPFCRPLVKKDFNDARRSAQAG
jgi:hypothetical protein